MTIIEAPPSAATDTPDSMSPTAVSPAPEVVSTSAEDVSSAPKRRPIKAERDHLMTVLSVVAAVGGTLIGVIGFAMSYSTLATVALSWGFSQELAPWFPIGVDASIIAFLALDLYLIRKATPWPLLRMSAHAMTGATIWFNASSQGHIGLDPVRAASHGVMPVLFVLGVEAARRLFIKKAQIEAGTHADRIPLHRWILSPMATPRFYRRMRLHGITSYPEMIRREQDLIAYEQWLKRKYDGDLGAASDDERLPMKMAAYGYTVAEALALPEQQEREAEEREEEAERRRLAAARRREMEQSQAERERLEDEGKLEAVRARVEGQTGQARAQARAQVSAAERAAELEEQALESAVMAEARAREAEAERKEAQEREQRAAAEVEAAELESQAARKRREAAEADRVAAAEGQAIETAEIAEARKRTAEADKAAAEKEKAAAEERRAAAEAERKKAEEEAGRKAAVAEQKRAEQAAAEAARVASEARRAAAEIERRAVEIEDEAKLTARQRAVRKVARMILQTAGGEADQLPLSEIQRALDVSSTDTASKYRQEAAGLIAEGYRPEA